MSSESRYLSFSLGEEHFALPLLEVKEVLAQPEVTPVPHTPAYFLGVMNLRGQVISVMDLRTRLGIKQRPDNLECVVIICRLGDFTVGITVDAVNSVLAPQPEEISGSLELTGSKGQEYIAGVYRNQQQLVLLLNVARALGLETRREASAAA